MGKSKSNSYSTIAWDNKTKQFVNIEEATKGERAYHIHDRLRYFTDKFDDNENIGEVLTVRVEHFRKNRKDKTKQDKVRACFASIAKNTVEYRRTTLDKQHSQESIVHKLAKQLFVNNEIEYIAANNCEVDFLNLRIKLLENVKLPILKFLRIEERDGDTNRIPDIVVETEIYNIKQELFIEICYNHPVDEVKKQIMRANKKNCIEISVEYLHGQLNLSEDSIKNSMIDTITNNKLGVVQWISIACEEYYKEIYNMQVKRRRLNDGFKRSIYYTGLATRLFIFKDEANFNKEHPKYYGKSCEIGDCKKCEYCLMLNNYDSVDIHDVESYCCINSLYNFEKMDNNKRLEFIMQYIATGLYNQFLSYNV